jgi:5-methylcytosine-specific restriction protein A
MGPIAPHALAEVVAGPGLKIDLLHSVEAMGERAKEPAPRAPSATEWDWIKEAILERDHHRCQTCGARERLQVDHILPIAKGGSSTPRNLWTLCSDCQTVKTGRPASSTGPRRSSKADEVAKKLKGRDMVFRD